FNGLETHLAHHDVTLSAVSRAPLAKLQGYKKRMGWTFPWASSFGGDFNLDFAVQITPEQQSKGGAEYNYRREGKWEPGDYVGPVADFAAMAGTDVATYVRERPGLSACALEDGPGSPRYATHPPGLDGLGGGSRGCDRDRRG